MDLMTDLLERAVATARGLSPEMQDEIARLVLAYAGEEQSHASPSRAFSRNTNFCTLPVEVFGSSPNTTWRGSL
jgi:hypothetical protein